MFWSFTVVQKLTASDGPIFFLFFLNLCFFVVVSSCGGFVLVLARCFVGGGAVCHVIFLLSIRLLLLLLAVVDASPRSARKLHDTFVLLLC